MLFNLKEEVLQWKEEYGTDAVNSRGVPYKKIDPKNLRESMIVLVEKLKALGAEKNYFYPSTVQNIIANECVAPQGAITADAYRIGRKKAWEALDVALIKVYGTDSEIRKRQGEAAKVAKPEVNPEREKTEAALEKRAEERIELPAVIRTPENTVHKSAVEAAVESAPPAKELKEFDPSKSNVPDPEVTIDQEMADILGYK